MTLERYLSSADTPAHPVFCHDLLREKLLQQKKSHPTICSHPFHKKLMATCLKFAMSKEFLLLLIGSVFLAK